MVSPVMAHDENHYERSVCEADPNLSREPFFRQKLQQEIQNFSKESLKSVEVHLMQENTPDELFALTAECIAVLDIEDEMVDKVLEAVEGVPMQRLLANLMKFMPLESLISLMNHRAQRQPTLSLNLAKLFILDHRTEAAAFEQAFNCLIVQAASNLGAIDLIEEVVEWLSSSQQAQLNAALSSNPRADEAVERLGRLKLKEASLKLSEGDKEAAISIVRGLLMIPGLADEALSLLKEADCIDGQLLILNPRLSACIQVLNSESPKMAEALHLMQQVFTTALRMDRDTQRREFTTKFESLQKDYDTLRQEMFPLFVIIGQLSPSINPPCICSYKLKTSLLYRTDLLTGEESTYEVPNFIFKSGCSLIELTEEGCLLVTGGSEKPFLSSVIMSRDVTNINTRMFEVSSRRPMTTARKWHAAVYHDQYVYILGGRDGSQSLSKCERYKFAENQWEELAPLPTACQDATAVVIDRTLYVLGGHNTADLNLIQVFSLDWRHWRSDPVLPSSGRSIACFKVCDTQAYFVLNRKLYSFRPQQTDQIQLVKLLAQDITSMCGPSHYDRGTLYCSSDRGAAKRMILGSLNR
jgi:hypothetical protein